MNRAGRRIIHGLFALSLPLTFLWAQTPVVGGTYQVLREYFDQPQPGAGWTLYSQVPDNSFRWQKAGEQPGFHFYNYGHGYGVATWNIGTQLFDLKFDVTVSSGMLHEYVRSGVFVALSTAPPDKQGPNDISTVVAIQGAGPAASVRQGSLFVKDTELSNISRWPAGGDVESIPWPNTVLDGTQLTVEMQRLNGNVMMYSIYRPDYKAGLEPWWTRRWTLPPALARTAFNTLIVETLNQDTTANAPQLSYAYQGVVSNIRGFVPGANDPPVVLSAMPVNDTLYRAGSTVTISGQGFQSGATVWIGGKFLTATVTSPTQLSVVLPDLPAGTYHLKVLNPDGLETELSVGITYSGPTVLRAEPREASPAGGDLVTLVGAGFDSATVVTIGNQPAPVVQLVDSFHLQVRVPAGKPGMAPIIVKSGGVTFAGSPAFGYAAHPYMYYSADDLAGLRKKFNDPRFADYRNIIVRNATDADPANPQGQVADYLWAYLLTGETRYRAPLFTQISQEIDHLDFTDFRQTNASLMATAYDTLFPELTPAERTAFLAYLDRALTVYRQMTAINAWFLGLAGDNISNTVAISNSSGGQIALVLRNSIPDASAVAALATKRLTVFANRCISADGGYIEGPLYWNYGLTWYLQFAHVLETVTGSDAGLLSQPNLLKNQRFVESTLAGTGVFETFNDAEPQLYGMAITADLGTRRNQPLMLWLADYVAHRSAQPGLTEDEASRYDIVPYAFLWRGNPVAPPSFPGLPVVSVLENMNWGVLRSSSDLQPGMAIGIKGAAGEMTHHAQNDAGSFILQAKGEDFFIDPGYYQPTANRHTLPLVDGIGPGLTGSVIDSVADTGGIRTLAVDSTRAYGGKALRVRRTVAMYSDRAAVVLDDIVPADGQPGLVVSQFQTGNMTATGGTGITVQGAQTQMNASFSGPSADIAVAGPNDFGNSWIYRANKVAWYSTNVSYRADVNKPLVTVIAPSAGVTSAVTYGAGEVTVKFSDGRNVPFILTPNGWKMQVRPPARRVVP